MKRIVTQRDFDRFAALSRDDNPIHCDPVFARGTHFGATVAHGMFLYGMICGAITRRFDTPWLPLTQTLMFPAPTFAGDATTVRVAAREPPGVFDVGIAVERDGRPVGTASGEGVVLGVPFAAASGAPDRVVERADESAGEPAVERETLSRLAPGRRAETTRCFDPGDLDEYADLCADPNPLVVDAAAARRAGLPARVVPGPLLSGMFSDLLGTRLPGRGTGWMKQSLRFLRPAHPGQALQAMVEVVRVRPDKQLVNLRSTVRDLSGVLLVDGEALVLVRDLER